MAEIYFNTAVFYENLQGHQLIASRCSDCGMVYLPPRMMCPRCYTSHMERYPLSGEGILTGSTTIFVCPPAMSAEGYSRENPYCVGVVKLIEGPSICGQILPDNCLAKDKIKVGVSVQAIFLESVHSPAREVRLAFTLTKAGLDY